MVLRCLPTLSNETIYTLLKMVPLTEDDHISVTVYISRHQESDNIHLTPSIYLSAQKYEVLGIKTIEEIKQLLMVNRFQLAKI